MFYALLIAWLATTSDGIVPEVRVLRVPDMETCWELIGKTTTHEVPEHATLTCVPLRHPKAT